MSSAASSTSCARSTPCASRASRSTSRACRQSSSSTPRSAPTAASSSSSTSRTTTARPSSPSASGRRSTTCRRASCTRTRRRWRRRCDRRATRAGSRCRRCCSRACVHYYGTDAKLRVFRFERWIPGEVDGASSHLPARVRARRRAGPRGAAQRGTQRNAVDGRAGIPLRAPASPAQHRQHVAAPARLGDVAASRVEPALAARCGAALARGLFRRHRGQDRARPAHRQRFRLDAALPRHHAARRIARARDRGVAPGRGHRPGSRRRRSTSCASRSSRR